MKLRLELIDDHDGSVSYRMIDLKLDESMAEYYDRRDDLQKIVDDMLDSYQKSKQKI